MGHMFRSVLDNSAKPSVIIMTLFFVVCLFVYHSMSISDFKTTIKGMATMVSLLNIVVIPKNNLLDLSCFYIFYNFS